MDALEDYKMLRDESMKRVDARNQILSYTLVFTASMFTLAMGSEGFRSALLVYPLVSFFFSVGFAYNSLMLIEIGGYLRKLEQGPLAAGWATYLKPRYSFIEPFEIISTSGLFIGTQVVAVLLYDSSPHGTQVFDHRLRMISILAVIFTFLSIIYPIIYHRVVLRHDK